MDSLHQNIVKISNISEKETMPKGEQRAKEGVDVDSPLIVHQNLNILLSTSGYGDVTRNGEHFKFNNVGLMSTRSVTSY